MGRYAQRRRSGGGLPSTALLIQMITASADGTETIVDYSGPVTAGDFELTDFVFTDGFQNPTAIAQSDTAQLILTTLTGVDEGFLSYGGDTPGISSPQNLEITPI